MPLTRCARVANARCPRPNPFRQSLGRTRIPPGSGASPGARLPRLHPLRARDGSGAAPGDRNGGSLPARRPSPRSDATRTRPVPCPVVALSSRFGARIVFACGLRRDHPGFAPLEAAQGGSTERPKAAQGGPTWPNLTRGLSPHFSPGSWSAPHGLVLHGAILTPAARADHRTMVRGPRPKHRARQPTRSLPMMWTGPQARSTRQRAAP